MVPGLEMGTLWVVPLLKVQCGDTTTMKNRIQFAQITGFLACTWGIGALELLRKMSEAHIILIFLPSFCVLRDGALCQRSYCGLLYSQGWRGECSVGRHGNQETVGKPGVSPVQKAMGLQEVQDGSFGGAVSDPRHPTLLQARGRMIETGDCKALWSRIKVERPSGCSRLIVMSQM